MSVFTRTGNSTMSKNLFALTMSGFTALGIIVSMMVAQFTTTWKIDIWGALIVLALGIVGVIVTHKSDVPIISLFGYMLVAVPYGALLGPFLNLYVAVSIAQVFLLTTVYVVVLGVVGAAIPDSLESWGSFLLAALVIGIIGYFAIPIAGFFGLPVAQALTFWDWAIVLLFGAIIIFDFNRAMRIPHTLDNAIDVALAIYLDWFNVFVRLLSLTGQKKSND